MTFLELAPPHINMPFHKHDFEVISRQPLLPIVDGYQEEQIVEKCKICGEVVTKLNYGISLRKDYYDKKGYKFWVL